MALTLIAHSLWMGRKNFLTPLEPVSIEFDPVWLELPPARTNVHGPMAVRAIEVLLYILTEVYINGGNTA